MLVGGFGKRSKTFCELVFINEKEQIYDLYLICAIVIYAQRQNN
jgi:hypothetical protein